MKHIELTDAMRDALDAIERAQRLFLPGLDSAAIVEIPKLRLANATIDAVRAAQLARVPRPRPARAVSSTKRRKRA